MATIFLHIFYRHICWFVALSSSSSSSSGPSGPTVFSSESKMAITVWVDPCPPSSLLYKTFFAVVACGKDYDYNS